MKQGFTLFLLLFSAFTASVAARAEEPSTATTAPYLLAGAPTFDLSISQFRENFNTQNPKLILNEFSAPSTAAAIGQTSPARPVKSMKTCMRPPPLSAAR